MGECDRARQSTAGEGAATLQWPPERQKLHLLFADQAAATPSAIAVEDARERIAYAEIDRRSTVLANALIEVGAGPEKLVGLCVDRSAAMIVALLAILKTGAAYVPLDPGYPPDRIAFMIDDAAVALVLSERALAAALPALTVPVLLVEDVDLRQASRPLPATDHAGVTQAELAYVIYTSGSTGRPKGVEILHRGVVNLLFAMQNLLDFTPADRFLAVTSLSFDVSVEELFLPLIAGGTVIVASRAEAADGERLLARLQQSRATVMDATPVTWRLLIAAGWQGSPGLKPVCGGEAIDPALGRALLARTGRFWNLYGPTETTISATAHEVTQIDGPHIPIGRPLANTRLYILDNERRPVPPGSIGELYIGGAGVARGYRRRPELTAERFLDDPFVSDPRARMYRTGDLACVLPDGTFEFHGRCDDQVKLRGFRIELGEIEAVIGEFPGVRQAAAVARPDDAGDAELIAFIAAGERRPDAGEIRKFAAAKLPGYMVPSRIVTLDAFPTTPNGKLDRRGLLASLTEPGRVSEDREPPSDPVARKLIEIFEEVLAVRPVGLHDDFFDLGGHSLRAVRLVDLVERHFGKRLHLNTLYHQGSSVADLASILRDPRGREPLPYLVPLGRGAATGDGKPVFCLPTLVEGTLLFYEALARRLAPHHSLFGILPQGLEDGRPAHDDIDEMAVHCVRVMRNRQPQGPYRLLGFSSAGILALAVARQFREAGEAVALLGLLDSHCPLARRTWRYHREILDDRLQRLGNILATRLSMRTRRIVDAQTRAARSFRWCQRRAVRSCRMRRYDGSLMLVVTEETRRLFHDEFIGWERLASEVDGHVLPGGHYDLVNEPGVAQLAELLRLRLMPQGWGGGLDRPARVHA